MKKAFTMLELVMVMVIMGIVASIGADIIAAMYTNYLRSRTINALESKTEIVLEQIAKRLQYRIKESVIARKTGSITALASADDTYSILEWIGYSNESFLGTPRPSWSGFIDLDSNETDSNDSNKSILKSSESELNTTSAIMAALSNNTVDLNSNHEAGLVFKGRPYNHNDFGWGTSSNNDGLAIVKVIRYGTSLDVFEISNDANPPTSSDPIYEQYYLAHTAYAIAPTIPITTNGFTNFDLLLHYNYQPWLGGFYSDSNSTLAQNVSLFRFKQDESIIRLKLCLHDNNETGTGDYIVVCKEKVVY
jgi:prepilin-type N-terminal cleavage/methylation domain-containing protein